MKRSSGLDLTKNNDTEEEEEKVYFFGDDPDVEHASGDLNRSSQEYSLPKIFITNELERSFSLDVDDRLTKKAIHESLTNVKANEITTSNEFLLPGFCRAGSDSAVNSDRSGKLSEEDYRNIIKLVCNLQSVAKTLSDNYEKLLSNKNNKQLNFRSRDDIINATSTAVDSIKTKRDLRLLVRPEIRKSEEHPTYFRSRSRTDTLSRASSQFFFENERLLDFKANGIGNMRWNDAISVTSPCSTVPESPFDSSKKSRSQSIIFPKRSVLKNGQCNVLKKSSNSNRRIRYLQDIFTTLVDVKWRWTLVVFALSFIMSWLFYAGIYWLIAYAHGDFEHLEDENWRPCVENLFNFASCFLFSVETQHTIGYGGRATNEECPEAIFVMCIQSITGVMISAFLAGIFFAKMSRPKQRRQTLLFSRKAVICQRDTQLCLMFRVGDMRKSHIIGSSIRAHIFRTRTTREGEELPQYQCELSVSADGCESNLFFIWPVTVVHIIDKDSPLYTTSAQDLLHEDFEIVAILEGTVESTGQTTQARTSYLPNEIKWGHRFESILSYNMERQCYEVDYKSFNNTMKVATPLCSAKDLDELYMVQTEICDAMTIEPESDAR
ncbi:hypothetical protein RUM43_004544 [Polyplax serrata]|uniref:Uncharacterized protein n=1 Tax=Polyplax serrata TaxID=468196 RepID=A0AAN8SBQ1_POLSC